MPGSPQSWRELYRRTLAELGSEFEARQLVEFVAGHTVPRLLLEDASPAPDRAAQALAGLCARRRAGEPLQYLLGEWEFYSLPFYVGEGVLIPRQDTETLVDAALALLAGIEHPEILDLCSGSGCVAVAVAHGCPVGAVTALELSPAAHRYLARNIARNRVKVRAVQGDLHRYTHPRPLDMIIANPPYIPHGELGSLQEEVRREPRQALDGGDDGLDFYRAIAQRYLCQLAPGGWLLLEVGAGQSVQVRDILLACGFASAEEKYDLAGIARVVMAQRPHQSGEENRT